MATLGAFRNLPETFLGPLGTSRELHVDAQGPSRDLPETPREFLGPLGAPQDLPGGFWGGGFGLSGGCQSVGRSVIVVNYI